MSEGNPLPDNWAPMTGHEKVTLVKLNTTSIEYQDVLRKFQATAPYVKVQKIERVQNPELYRTFMGKKQEMDKRCGGNSERRLFHGTDGKSIDAINSQGFNRSFCGKNGRCIQESITSNRLLVHLITDYWTSPFVPQETFIIFATCTSPKMYLICPPKFFITIVFNFPWDGCNTQEMREIKVMQTRCIMGDVQMVNGYTKTRSDWLFFFCNDPALLARCPRHIQSVFNLIVDILMDIYVMVNW